MSDLSGVVNEQKATIEALRRRVAELEEERDRWKSAHHEMVDRNKLLRDRPDLPIERLQAYKQITAENAELKRQVEALREDAEVGRLVTELVNTGGYMMLHRGDKTVRCSLGLGGVKEEGSLLEALREAAKGEVE